MPKVKHFFPSVSFLRSVMAAMAAVLVAVSAMAGSGDYLVRGIVRDSLTMEGLPYAAVTAMGSARGTVSDARGIWELTVPADADTLTVSVQGYGRRLVPVAKNRVNLYEVLLTPQAQELGELVVTRKKYSKKNNPAVDLMERIRATASVSDPRRNPFYNFRRYERISIGINDFHAAEGGSLLRRFPFLEEYVDTSEVSGKPILSLSVKEESSDVHYRRRPQAERRIVTGVRSEGVDQITDQESMRTFLQDVLRDVDLYDRDINLLQNRFVSPLSPLAADFYKFYITDSTSIDGEKCLVLSFYPHNKSTFGFIGQMFVQPTDSDVFIRRVTMRVPAEINLNFIQSLRLAQDFRRAPDGSRLKTADDLTLEISVMPGTPGLYVRRAAAFADHSFDAPADTVFASKLASASAIQTPEAEHRDEVFWQGVRLIELPPAQARMSSLMQRLRSVPLYYWGEKFVKMMASGYVATGHDSRFDIGPLNTFISGNTLEGLRLRLGGMTTANLSPHFFSRFHVAYGFRDHRWKYGLELEWSFNRKKYHSREFPIHSLRLNSLYDVDQLGQHYLFTNADNVFLAWKRMPNRLVTYHRYNALTYTLELPNNFSVTATLANDRQEPSRLLQFALSPDVSSTLPSQLSPLPSQLTPLPSFQESYADLTLRFAPGEKFYQTRSYRIPVNMDAPVITLSHRYGPGGRSWSRWAVNRTELSVMKRFWFSAWGYADILASGGHVWSKGTPYTQLFIPNANLSYTIQPESFALLNPMEFVTDSYAQLFATYWANGAILNYIPLVKKLKLREVFSISGFWGTLSHRNSPDAAPGRLALPDGALTPQGDASRTPYIEASVGLDNILRCIRLDYVWRITHRHPAYPADRRGVRLALHFTF